MVAAYPALGDRVQIVGGRRSSSPVPRGSKRGIAAGRGDAILVKVNQVGTLSETLATVSECHARLVPVCDLTSLR